MACRPIQNGIPREDPIERRPETAPAGGDEGSTVYLCDRSDEVPPHSAPDSGFIPRSNPLLASSPPVRAAPPPPATGLQLPAPPESPLARILYDLTTQLEDLHVTTTLTVPVEGLNEGGDVTTITRAMIGERGALVALGVELHPAYGPIRLCDLFGRVPVVGPFFQVRVLKLRMDRRTRRMEARVRYLMIPFYYNAHDRLLNELHLPAGAMRGEGYDLRRQVPLFTWQALDLFLKAREELAGRRDAESPLADARPNLEEALIQLEGNFSNRTVSSNGMTVEFSDLPPQQQHRVEVRGRLLEPIVTIHGVRSGELRLGTSRLRLTNTEERPDPLEVQVRVDPTGRQPVSFEIPSYRSHQVNFERFAEGEPSPTMNLTMQEGLALQGLRFWMDDSGPHLQIREMTVRQVAFVGPGVRLQTTSGDQAVFRDVDVGTEHGVPRFQSMIQGAASGDVQYDRDDAPVGLMQFRYLEGLGRVVVGPDENNIGRIEIAGNITTLMPVLHFVVRSGPIQGSVSTEITEATVSGAGRLAIWPSQDRAVIEAGRGNTFRIQGHGGMVHFHQDPSQVPSWPEMRRELGLRANQVVSDLYIQPSNIHFDIHRMELGFRNGQERAALEIRDAEIGTIGIMGDVWGQIFARLPGGAYDPIVIPEDAMMRDASVRIGTLSDQTQGDHRQIDFSQIHIEGEESRPTFSPRDQRRCGFDRQHVHATLGTFSFSPDTREIQIGQVDPHFHIVLQNLLGRGCLVIE